MEHIKNIIGDRKLFESDSLPIGHKARFLQKMENRTTTKNSLFKNLANTKLYKYYIAAALVLAFIIISPIFKSISSKEIDKVVDNKYVTIINEKSDVILSMIGTLDLFNRDMIISTLDQLVFEAIPFGEQLPQSIDPEQREILEQSYYNPKIEGIDKLKVYVSQLLEF